MNGTIEANSYKTVLPALLTSLNASPISRVMVDSLARANKAIGTPNPLDTALPFIIDTAKATPLAVDLVVRNPDTTLKDAITPTQITIKVASATGFPTTNGFQIQIDKEIMLVTDGAGTTNWTVTRGYVGTASEKHNAYAAVGPMDKSAWNPENVKARLKPNSDLGDTGSVLVVSTVQGLWTTSKVKPTPQYDGDSITANLITQYNLNTIPNYLGANLWKPDLPNASDGPFGKVTPQKGTTIYVYGELNNNPADGNEVYVYSQNATNQTVTFLGGLKT